jgi:hypothetical protein
LVATGRKIGVKISTAGVMSMKEPTASSKKLLEIRISNGFSESPEEGRVS